MNRIAIAGAAGRMGRNLVMACHQADGVELTQALERSDSPALGSDSGVLAGLSPNDVIVSDRLDPGQFDILIDFSRAVSLRSAERRQDEKRGEKSGGVSAGPIIHHPAPYCYLHHVYRIMFRRFKRDEVH